MTPAEIIADTAVDIISAAIECDGFERDISRDAARRAIAALAAAGLKIVGREPTEAMLDAARGIYDLARTPNSDWFRAMFDAAPPLDAGDGK